MNNVQTKTLCTEYQVQILLYVVLHESGLVQNWSTEYYCTNLCSSTVLVWYVCSTSTAASDFFRCAALRVQVLELQY